MPLYKTIKPNSKTTVYVWDITEPLDWLLEDIPLKEDSLSRISNMKSEIHQRGFVSVRHLLKAAGYTDFDLYYDDEGKPHLKDDKFISITHSFTYSAIIVSDQEVGIDIEKNRNKITRIAHKFIKYENAYLSYGSSSIVEQLTIIWGAKESIYKIDSEDAYSFKDRIAIESFNLNDKQTEGFIIREHSKKYFKLFFEPLIGFTLVYAFIK